MMHCASDTLVIATQLDCITAAAGRTVKEVVPPSNTAYTATITMEHPFRKVIVVELANITKILPKDISTAFTGLLYALHKVTIYTANGFYGKTV